MLANVDRVCPLDMIFYRLVEDDRVITKCTPSIVLVTRDAAMAPQQLWPPSRVSNAPGRGGERGRGAPGRGRGARGRGRGRGRGARGRGRDIPILDADPDGGGDGGGVPDDAGDDAGDAGDDAGDADVPALADIDEALDPGELVPESDSEPCPLLDDPEVIERTKT